ncbi:MAG: ATP-dependent DNA helicase RecG [Oscillospiraceae bacterium]|nr:ATP-dependent DNA helicase RecG [Oscillospiraceae bacterium]
MSEDSNNNCDNNYDIDIEKLKYVGEKRAKLYHKLFVFKIKDLLYYCPRTYINLTESVDIVNAPADQNVVLKVLITRKQAPMPTSRKGLVIYKIFARDSTSEIVITLFNEPYSFNKLEINEQYFVFGKITRNFYNQKVYLEISSPLIYKASETPKFVAIYQLTAGLTSKIISRNVCDALKLPGIIKEYLPDWILKKAKLVNLNQAIKNIHFPRSLKEIEESKKRIAFDELFIFSLCLILIKKNNLKSTSFVIKDTDLSDFYNILPFELTTAQNKVIDEIKKDMQREVPMSRLLQGDVGSGKTAVAMASIYLAYKNGIQSAFMAPTEILAWQHFDSIKELMSSVGLRVGLLAGSMSQKKKNIVKEKLMMGLIDVVVGTHAILQDDVVFKNLGLVITDEQHRFGVKQRAKLSEKGKEPHKLIMSATPIPRTLSMIMYGDLDISIIDKSPSNRKPVLTYYINESKRQRAYNFVKKLIDEGRQAYIVCPAIEDNETSDLKAVLKFGEDLKNNEFKDYKVEIIHGKTRAYDKDMIMQDFKDKKIDLLISTTVIEVGIDVPNAAVIVIEDAERFGLSQLHQLRGRVGRGKHQSYCLLISETRSLDSINKLKTMTKTNDGFKISEYDLQIRGPGDFFGSRQHGLPQFKNSDMIKDVKLLKLSQDIVSEILEKDLYLEKKRTSGTKKNSF